MITFDSHLKTALTKYSSFKDISISHMPDDELIKATFSRLMLTVRGFCSKFRGQTTLLDQQVMAVNLISSVGDIERATEHTCTAGEMSQWTPKLTRQVASPNYQ